MTRLRWLAFGGLASNVRPNLRPAGIPGSAADVGRPEIRTNLDIQAAESEPKNGSSYDAPTQTGPKIEPEEAQTTPQRRPEILHHSQMTPPKRPRRGNLTRPPKRAPQKVWVFRSVGQTTA